MIRVLSIYPIHSAGTAISHIFLSLCSPDLNVPIYIHGVVPSCDKKYRRSNLIEAIPSFLKAPIYKLGKSRQATEWTYLREIEQFDAAYIWPGVSLEMMRKVKAQCKPIFLERINCFTGKAKTILDDAYLRLNVAPQHSITTEMVQEELEQVHLSDFVFCPSPHVRDSFLEANVSAEKLLLTSYGWSVERFPGLYNRPSRIASGIDRPFTIVFVGRICVRKGAHLLLEAFVRSNVKGKLILCGEMEPVIAEVCKDWLRHPNVIYHPHTNNVTAFYRQADVFAFPSLEEGSPLVSYEAMAHGLPMLVSPMGGGMIVRDGIDGFILPPYDLEAWVESIRILATSPDLRAKMSYASWQRALEFTFDQVANRRAQQMLDHL